MTDHFHTGFSGNHKSRRAAVVEAERSWQDFTAFEYGGRWASFRLAASRGVKCNPAGGGWSCSVEARPCRYGGSKQARRR
ncbi:MAG: hypothetical protein ACK5JT_16685 [Hyphomicrobiaceae bacterium]